MTKTQNGVSMKYEELDFISVSLIQSLVKFYRDPRQAEFWSREGNGMDIMELSVRSGLLPPAALEEPRRFRDEIRAINHRLVKMESVSLIESLPGKDVKDGVRPTEEGVQAAEYLGRPWWQKLWDRTLEQLIP